MIYILFYNFLNSYGGLQKLNLNFNFSKFCNHKNILTKNYFKFSIALLIGLSLKPEQVPKDSTKRRCSDFKLTID